MNNQKREMHEKPNHAGFIRYFKNTVLRSKVSTLKRAKVEKCIGYATLCKPTLSIFSDIGGLFLLSIEISKFQAGRLL